uniref:Uncharacterized protein n=1 Tax=Arundo donax TaxID=35708 RepID=A0A0A9GBH7_ARUDO
MIRPIRMLGASLHLSHRQGRGSMLNEALTVLRAGCGLGPTSHEDLSMTFSFAA